MAIARFLSGIVTPGVSTYPSDDGSFTIVRGTGAHYGNGLIQGYIIGGASVGSNYDLDDNNTGLSLAPNEAPKFHVGGELQRFLDATEGSPEHIQYLKDQRTAEEVANPKLKAYDDALRAWAASQRPPVGVDPTFGFASGFDMAQAPDDVQRTYADFTGHPMPSAPPPPSGPSLYLVAGILFDANGAIYNQSTHNPTGEILTPAEVHSLLTTGQLPAGSAPPATQAPAPSAPPTSQPATQPATTPTPSATTVAPSGSGGSGATARAPSGSATDVGGNMAEANPQMSIAPAPGTPGTGTGSAAGDVTAPMSSSWMLYAALGVIALVAIRGSKH